MPHADVVLLFLAAVVGQALNAVAGGGSFITFPMLLAAGVAPIEANATSTIALWPGALASAWGYRRDFAADRRTVIVLACVSIAGGLVGALLLLATPEQQFRRLIPYLLGSATLLFAVSDRIGVVIRSRSDRAAGALTLVGLIQFAVAVYGGYFGGGIGIMMLATFSLMDVGDIHSMNGLKAVLGAVINSAAVVTFIVAHLVVWQYAVPMIVASILSGYASAKIARKIDPQRVRLAVVIVGIVLTSYFIIHH
ncbi:MAG TPA: sulfite exporter TauE/SafE family protein [Candidatus Eremiobacteraceae bacterium]|nr:sulfite exporter TauE/SafE family protein [Candidatus Eremiobacteraceae bacterium]